MKNIYRLIYTAFILLIFNNIKAVDYTFEDTTLSSQVTGTNDFKGRDQIVLNPGFHSLPSGTDKLTCEIDEKMIFNLGSDYLSSEQQPPKSLNTNLPVGSIVFY